MNIKIIKNEQHYNEAMTRLSELMSLNPTPNSSAEDELELLAIVIESYESSIVPTITPDPIEAILFRMDQMGLSRKDLEKYIGSASKVSEILSRKRPLSLNMIRRLNIGLDIPADILIAGDVLGDNSELEYDQFPIKEMDKRGLFAHLNIAVTDIKEYAQEYISRLMTALLPAHAGPALLRSPLHQNGSKQADIYSLTAWRMCVIKKARTITDVGIFQKEDISLDWLRNLAKLSVFKNGPILAQEYLRRYGIILVIEPHFPKTYLDGAAMLDEGTPIVALTIRQDRLDNFWFVLMHELAHVWKHLGTDNPFIVDDERKDDSAIEREADLIALDVLIPNDIWQQCEVKQTLNPNDAIRLAHQLSISPAIVAGRVRKEANDYKLMTKLVGHKEVGKLFFDDSVTS